MDKRATFVIPALLAALFATPHACAASFAPAAPMLNFHDGHTATLLPSGKVLVAGGFIAAGFTEANAELYDPASNAWILSGSLATSRAGHTATLLPGGKVLVAGGENVYRGPPFNRPITTDLYSTELYDPASNTWSAGGGLASPRYLHTATLLQGGKVLVVGGYDSSGAFSKSAELYDPASNSWSPAGSLSAGRDSHTATLLPSGKVLVAGGFFYDTASHALNSAELYDPASDTWSAAGSLSTARYSHTATLLPNGQVLVAGGSNVLSNVGGAEIYDPSTNTWRPAGDMVTPRFSHTATLLPTGKVLIVGGDGESYSNSSELYDPASDTWTPSASLAEARLYHTATLLPNGQVLVAGGENNRYLSSAELYTRSVPAITSPRTAVGLAGISFNYTITASGVGPIIFAATPLPRGLTVTSNGNISGIPIVPDTTSVTLSATNDDATGTATLALTVVPNMPPTITQLTSSESPARTGTVLTFTLAASDVDSPLLNYALDFGDGSAPATGTLAPDTAASIPHTYTGGGDFKVTATVSDGVTPVQRTLTQTIFPPASGGSGVPNISQGIDAVTNPDDGLVIEVAHSDSGMIELNIDASGVTTSDPLVFSTVWGDTQGHSTTVVGPQPVHTYSSHGVFVAAVTANSAVTGAHVAMGRKTLVISASETGETMPATHAVKPVATPSPLLSNAPKTVVALTRIKGKFYFTGSKSDTLTFTGTFQLPPGFNIADTHDFSMGMGNIVVAATVDAKGKGRSPSATLKILKLTYNLKKGQLAKGGEPAAVKATFTAAGMVNAGFDTEGITPKAKNPKTRSIQVSFQLDGAAYEALIPVQLTLSKDSGSGTIAGKR